MKTSLYFTAALLLGAVMTGCQDDYENVGSSENNRIFCTSNESVTTLVLDGKADEASRSITMQVAQPVSEPIDITFGVDGAYVEEYNNMYNQEAILLPSENYTIANPNVTIPTGHSYSDACVINFTGLNNLDTEYLYVLPVKVTSSTVPVLGSKDVNYYVFRGAALINVVGGLKQTCLTFVNEGQTPALSGITDFTFECLINPTAFDRMLSTLMGIEGACLIRIGDAGIPSNQLQFAKGSNATDAAWQFEIGKWTFLTMTFKASTGEVEVYFDGVKKGSTQRAGTGAVNWNVASTDRACYIGYAYDTDRYFDGWISEVRVWNKILTTDEINARNHFYRVAEDADGLVGYWKFDEGSGNYIHDYANGYDMQVPATYPGKSSTPGELQWKEVQLP